MAAMDRTACQIRMIAQDGIQRQLILTNKRTGAVVLVPIGKKLKEFRDRYRKYARFSVKILRLVFTPSSYSLEANASSGRARIFHAFSRKPRPSGGSIVRRATNGRPPLSSTPLIMSSRHPMRHRPRARLAAHHQPTQNRPDRRAATWKTKPRRHHSPQTTQPPFLFPSSGPLYLSIHGLLLLSGIAGSRFAWHSSYGIIVSREFSADSDCPTRVPRSYLPP